jgi:linoleoyl-CoA desaturase
MTLAQPDMTATADDLSSRLGVEAASLGFPAAATPGTLKFATGDYFQPELRRRVDQYFKLSGRRPRDCPAMYLKTALIFSCLGVSYVGLVFLAASGRTALPLAIVLGLSMAAVGFNVQHDGGHQAYSDRGWINKLMAMSLDLLGGSSYVWAKKHNSVHHSYTNVTGHDDDINIGVFGRLSPHQPRRDFHRLQHFYLWLLYGLLPIKWQLYDDFRDVLLGRIGGHRMPRPKGWDLVVFITGKATFFSLAFVVPLMLHAAWSVLLFYVLASFAQGVVLSTVFQMAHCVESAAFPLPRPDDGRINAAWAVHQVETTVDFARDNPLLSWIIGGLNFQIEHHLFPRVCHVHYPALAPIVETTCREFGVRYVAHATLLASIASHFRWLRSMGAAPSS